MYTLFSDSYQTIPFFRNAKTRRRIWIIAAIALAAAIVIAIAIIVAVLGPFKYYVINFRREGGSAKITPLISFYGNIDHFRGGEGVKSGQKVDNVILG